MVLVQLQKAAQIDERRGGSGPVANQVLRGMQIGVDHGHRCDGQRAAEQIGGHPVIAPRCGQHPQLVQAQTRQLGLVHHLQVRSPRGCQVARFMVGHGKPERREGGRSLFNRVHGLPKKGRPQAPAPQTFKRLPAPASGRRAGRQCVQCPRTSARFLR